MIANEKINMLLSEVRKSFRANDSFDMRKQMGTFKFCVIRATSLSSSISFVLNDDSSKLREAVEKIEEYAKNSSAENVVVTYVTKDEDISTSEEFFAPKGNGELKETFIGKTFLFSAQSFFQNNTEMAEKMHEYIHNLLKNYDTKNLHLLDLYGGVGTFGIINSELFKKTTVIESFPPSIEYAVKNIESNKSNAEALLLNAKSLKKIEFKEKTIVITDPPRTGMDKETIDKLKEMKPEAIIYICCNINEFKIIPGYQIKSAAVFDLFPQTNHMEVVVELNIL